MTQYPVQLSEWRHAPHVAVVIPTYRAAAHIARVVAGIPPLVTTIIVIDDCSPDASAEAARSVGDPRVSIIRLPENLGVGGATLTGYRAAVASGADVIVKMDADGQMDPAYLPILLRPLLRGEADYTKGNRFLYARELSSMPFVRRFGNLGLSFLAKLASGYWGVFDPTNGYTAIFGVVASKLDENRIDSRFFFETSMLVELGMLRAVVRDVSIPARYGSEASNLSETHAMMTFPPLMLRACLRRLWIQHFLRDFGLFSIFLLSGVSLLAFGVAFGGYFWWRNYHLGILTPTGTVMLAALSTILAVQFLLQAVSLDVQSVPVKPLHSELIVADEPETTLARNGSEFDAAQRQV